MEPSLDPLFRPESVAVIGASRTPGTIGYQIVDNLLRHGFKGVLYPVNPNARAIHSVPAYPSISAIPEPVDMAVVVVPKEAVLEVVDECGQNGVRGVVVISAGFREVGGEGIGREEALVRIVRRHGMRSGGPQLHGAHEYRRGRQHECYLRSHHAAPRGHEFSEPIRCSGCHHPGLRRGVRHRNPPVRLRRKQA